MIGGPAEAAAGPPSREGTELKNYYFFFLLSILLISGACRSHSRSSKSFDEICRLVSGKSASEVEALLGKPDSREDLAIGDQRWIWWNYTSLEGENYAPELRGKVVHLEITFSSPIGLSNVSHSPSQWRVSSPLSVSFVLPQTGH
jgi:hypothetical protein